MFTKINPPTESNGTMSTTEQRYRQKELSILAAAEQLFLAQGYGATTMDAIAREARVTKQTVYRYFPSKQALFTRLIQQNNGDHTPFRFGSGPVHQELQAYAEAFITFHMAPKRLSLYQLMLGESKTHPEIAEVFRHQARRRWQGILADYLRRQLRDSSRAETCGSMFNALLLHQRTAILMGLAQIPDGESIRHQALLATELFLKGVALDGESR